MDAFRRYDPVNQRQKMVRLFMGLCQEAQIVERPTKRLRVSARRKHGQPAFFSPTQPRNQNKLNSGASEQLNAEKDYRLISAVIQHLPPSGSWTIKERKYWLDAMAAAVDLIVQIKDGQSNALD